MNKQEMREKFDLEHPSFQKERTYVPLTKEEIIKVATEFQFKGSVILATELNRSTGVIAQIVHRLRREGINVPPPPPKGGAPEVWSGAIEELKNRR